MGLSSLTVAVESVLASYVSLLCPRYAVLVQTSIEVLSSDKSLRNAQPSGAAAEVPEQPRMKPIRRSTALCDLHPKIGVAICDSGTAFRRYRISLPTFSVRRPSVSFWTALLGAPGQILAALLPACRVPFWPSVLRCLGAGTRLASTIRPAIGMKPHLCNCQSQAFITLEGTAVRSIVALQPDGVLLRRPPT